MALVVSVDLLAILLTLNPNFQPETVKKMIFRIY